MLYKDQGFEFDIKILQKDLSEFILERLKNYLKDKQVRNDIIESSTKITNVDEISKIYKKSIALNKNIKKDFGQDVISIYKPSSKILYSEKENSLEIIGSADQGLF